MWNFLPNEWTALKHNSVKGGTLLKWLSRIYLKLSTCPKSVKQKIEQGLFDLLGLFDLFVSKWNKKDFKSESGLYMPFYAFQMRLLAIINKSTKRPFPKNNKIHWVMKTCLIASSGGSRGEAPPPHPSRLFLDQTEQEILFGLICQNKIQETLLSKYSQHTSNSCYFQWGSIYTS